MPPQSKRETDKQTDGRCRVPLGKGLPLLEATFLERPNQFTLFVEYQDRRVQAAMADRGRLRDVLTPGRTLLMEYRDDPKRKTAYQVLAARGDQGQLISLDTLLPNRLVARVLEARAFEQLPPYTRWKAEQKVGHSRFDFALQLEDERMLLMEVKSVGRLDEDGVARFPDAPTSRGVRHVQELTALATEGKVDCALLFVIQGETASHVEVDTDIDPALHEALCKAQQAGVSLLARACRLDVDGLTWGEARALKLDV